MPTTEDKATGYVVTLACGGVKAATAKFHLAGLRQAHIKAGLTPPNWGKMAKLAQIRRGWERWEVSNGPKSLVRHPVRWHHMKALQVAWAKEKERGCMLWAAACMCFFGCLRAGEALAPETGEFDVGAHLAWADVEIGSRDGKQVIRVRIKESKTDKLRKGAYVWLESVEGPVCPVTAVMTFMVDRRAGPGPFFVDGQGVALTRSVFVKEVKSALESQGWSSDGISGHSFRIGAATAAAAGGATDEEVKALGRWKSREYQGYIRREGPPAPGASKCLREGAEENCQ